VNSGPWNVLNQVGDILEDEEVVIGWCDDHRLDVWVELIDIKVVVPHP